MNIKLLETVCFRNLHDQVIEPGERFNIFIGLNAQGKTNVLEAVYLVACLRSFRGARSAEMIRIGQQRAIVRSSVTLGDVVRELEVTLHSGGKTARRDGKLIRSTAGYLGGLNVVMFSPDDPQIPKGSPKGRRQLLDRAIANLWPSYVTLCRDYQKTLQSRNRLLQERPSRLESLLEVYDEQLAQLAARMIASRMRYLRALGDRFASVYERISRSDGSAELVYQAPPEILEASDKLDQVRVAARRLLRSSRSVDRHRQSTTSGPHTHDVDFRLGGRCTRGFASQGQLRLLMLTFKIVQIMDAFERSGDYPVLLLDDVSSELDPRRNEYLFDFIREISCQAFITTTMAELMLQGEERIDFQLVEGKICRVQ